MRVVTLLFSGSLLAGLTGGGTEPPICADALQAVTVPLLNALRDELSHAGDDVTVVLAADSHTVTGEFRLASDGCFVHELDGPGALVVR